MDNANVTFIPENMYNGQAQADGDTMRLIIVNYSVAQAPADAVTAKVVNGWHTSKSDPKVHCTVDYRCNGKKKNKRRHVYDTNGLNR